MRTSWLAACGLLLCSCASESGGGRDPSSFLGPAKGAYTSSLASTAAPLPAAEGPSMVIVSYNVNFGLAGEPSVLEALASIDADVILLQETNEAWEQSLGQRFGDRYPHRAFKHCCNAGGLGVMSRRPFEAKEYVHPEGAWFPAWRVIAETPVGRVQMINVHLRPNVSDGGSVVSGVFTTPAVRLAEMERYAELLEPGMPALVAGDFNESFEGSAVLLLRDRGMTSALAELHGSRPTWRWPTPLGELRKQLDHIVVSPELVAVSVDVVERGSSDHFPVVATLARRRE